jgi:hypothetical protein
LKLKSSINVKCQLPSTAPVHCPGTQILLGGKGRRGHLIAAEVEEVVADGVEASSDTPAVVDSAGAGIGAGTAVAEVVDIVVAEVAGTAAAAVEVADIAPAELAPAAAAGAPLDPHDAHAHSIHHLGHVAAQIDPSTIFDGP